MLAMHLKLEGHCFGVLLLSAIITTTMSPVSAGRSEPAASRLLPDPPDPPHAASHSRVTTNSTEHLSSLEAAEPLQSGSVSGAQGSSSSPKDPETHSSAGRRPEPRLKPRMVVSACHKSFHKPRKAAGEWIYSLHSPPHGNCRKGNIKHVVQGRFYTTSQLKTNVPSLGYQSDAAASAQPQRGRPRMGGQRVSSHEESWHKLQPVVECSDDFMTLTVRKRRAIQIRLDRANDSSVPLSQLSPQCGYFVKTSWRDLSLKAQYDACHVTQEDGSFVLPLLWRGAPVRMSCPLSKIQSEVVGPSSLCCSPYGLTVKVPGPSATQEHRVNVRGKWIPLVLLAEQCGFTLDRQGAETALTAPFITCGIVIKDGEYTLTVEMGNEVFLLACPIAPLEELPVTQQPVDSNDPPHRTSGSTPSMPGSRVPFPWGPPFYLAPPRYPHPTIYRGHAHSEVQDTPYNPTPPALSPESTFRPRSVPPLYSQSDYQGHFSQRIPPPEPHGDLRTRSSSPREDELGDSSRSHEDSEPEPQQRSQEFFSGGLSAEQRSSPTGFPAQVEAPHLQPHRHDFNPYYHDYHHPKVPCPGAPPQDPDPGLEVSQELSATRFDDRELPVLQSRAVQESEDLGNVHLQQVLPPEHESSSPNIYIHPANGPRTHESFDRDSSEPLRPLRPYPYYYFYYFPHAARGDVKRLSVLHRDQAASGNFFDNQSLPHSPVPSLPSEGSTKTYIHGNSEDMTSKSRSYSPVTANEDLNPELEDNTRCPKTPSPVEPPPVVQSLPSEPNPAAVVPEQPSLPPPDFNYNPNPYQYYYHHPYYDYDVMYSGPEGLFSLYNSMPPSSSKSFAQDSSSPPQASVHPKPTTDAPPRPLYDSENGHTNPYFYYYHRYNQPDEFRVDPQPRPTARKESDKSLEYGSMEWFVRERGRHGVPMPTYDSFPGPYPHYASQQQPHHPPVGQFEEEKQLDNGMQDHSKANSQLALLATPCGFGPTWDPDCSNSTDCCFHTVEDCTVGPYFVFVVPDSVVEPTVVPATHSPEDSNASCTLQRLTSDLDIYMVPLVGCGVDKHMFGDTALHLSEVQGVHPHQDAAQEILPVGLTVGCSSSSEFPGEVMSHVMDQPPRLPPQPTPAAVSVRLRIATDQSFTSFYPEAHLPFSLVRGRPVHVEVDLLDPWEPDVGLLVHSCLAYTQDPYASWMLVYDGCQHQGASQLLPATNSHRITIFSFLPLHSESSSPHTAEGGRLSFLRDPEIYFMCLTEVCSAADCTLSCFKGPQSDTRAMK